MPPVLPPSIGAAPTAGGLLHLALDVLASASRQLEAAAQHAGRKPKDDAQALIQADRTLRSTLVHLDELQRLEANNWPTIDEPVAPQEVVESTVAATLGRGNGQIGLEQVIPDEVPLCVRGDGKRLRHALGALVEFAAAGTSGSGLQVGARWRGGPSHGMAVFYVHDPSPGASAALDLGLANPTALHADMARCPDPLKGPRIGLEVARRLVASLGGRIALESGLGRGLTLWLEFPSTTDLTGLSSPSDRSHRGLEVLLVEDNAVNQAVAQMMLEHLGCKVWTATDGVEATVLLEHGRFDLIFMDLHMPRMDGLAATRWLRTAEGDGPGTPVIAVTANVRPGTREACKDAGMNDFIAKPVSTEALRNALDRWAPAQVRHAV